VFATKIGCINPQGQKRSEKYFSSGTLSNCYTTVTQTILLRSAGISSTIANNMWRSQGDQTGRKFAQWANVYSWLFVKNYRSSPHGWATFCTVKIMQ
jgi:hypothetical protein